MSIIGIEKEIYDSLSETNFLVQNHNLSKIKDDLIRFLVKSSKEKETAKARKDLAVKMISAILDEHEKAPAFEELLQFLEDIEIGAQFFDNSLRDHLVHSFSNYLLGLYFISKSGRIREMTYPVASLSWKLAAFLHDIGYPIQIMSKQTTQFFSKIADFKQQHQPQAIDQKPKVTGASALPFMDYIKNLETTYRKEDAYTVISQRLHKWNIQLDLKDLFYEKAKQGLVNHGILSSLIVLSMIDSLYAYNNPDNLRHRFVNGRDWGRDWFDEHIIDAVAAISAHDLIEEPAFAKCRIESDKAPLLYLLVLTDTIQVWRRTSVFREIYQPNCIKIAFLPDLIKLDLKLDQEDMEETKHVLEEKLLNPELKIAVN